jgi:hypothetical protein
VLSIYLLAGAFLVGLGFAYGSNTANCLPTCGKRYG